MHLRCVYPIEKAHEIPSQRNMPRCLFPDVFTHCCTRAVSYSMVSLCAGRKQILRQTVKLNGLLLVWTHCPKGKRLYVHFQLTDWNDLAEQNRESYWCEAASGWMADTWHRAQQSNKNQKVTLTLSSSSSSISLSLLVFSKHYTNQKATAPVMWSRTFILKESN